jgi:hypothetical protein
MLSSSSALLLTAIASPSPADVTPSSLAVEPRVIERPHAPYDWTLQQARRKGGKRLNAETAACDTGPTITNLSGRRDAVPDCRFD